MKLEDLRKLHQKKYRDELGCFLVEGEHLVQELHRAARNDPRLLDCELYVTASYGPLQSPFPVHVLSARQMAQLSETRSQQGIVARVPKLSPPAPRAGERAVCLFEIQDPGNLGTILRTLAWFGGFRCLLTPHSVDPFNAKVVRASQGAIFSVPLETDVALESLRERYGSIACLDLGGESITSAGFRHFDCFVFGNEARGLPRDLLAACEAHAFTIGGGGSIESMNLAAAVNICLYELNRPD